MSRERKHQGGMSAVDPMAQLEANPEFQRKKAERVAELDERRRLLAAAGPQSWLICDPLV